MSDTRKEHCSDWLDSYGFGLTDDQRICIGVLVQGLNMGIYNINTKWKKDCFKHPNAVMVDVNNSRFATYDFDQLTRLVIAAHDDCVRVEISPSGPRMMKISLHKRKRDGERMYDRHPTLEDAIQKFRPALREASND